ncbi:MAG: hypothetical protein ACRDOY_08400 [Nocardioidaceae bacterium]
MTSAEDDTPLRAKTRRESLDPTLLALLDGSGVHHAPAQAMPLITTGREGAPHIALISAGEVLAVDERTLRLALWSTSTTAANLSAQPRATLSLVADGAFVGLHLDEVARGRGIVVGVQQLAVFHAHVESVTLDRVPYAHVTSGITFVTVDDSVPERWQSTLDLLRAAEPQITDEGRPPG